MANGKQAMIYVGLNDSKTHKQKFDTEKYLSVLKKICREYHTAFSVQEIKGGYFHKCGDYVEETTLVLTLINQPDETILEIAKDLCAFFNQESVMISRHEVDYAFISDSLTPKTE